MNVSIYDDYEIVVVGVASMLAPYEDRVIVVELNANTVPTAPVDIALYDSFAQGEANHPDVEPLLAEPLIARVVMYTWNFDRHLVEAARSRGLGGYLSKSLSAADLVDALERIRAGSFVTSEPPPSHERSTARGDWPGRSLGLTERESEVLALITQGHDTATMASTLYLSANSVKTHIKSMYLKIDVHTRTQAALWGIEHGFGPDHFRRRSG